MGIDAIPDDLLELILLLIASSVFLVRAASTCKHWRRVIADAGFLRRFRSLHRPLVAGYYHDGGYSYDAIRFSRSDPPVVDGRHFSLEFLPGNHLDSGIWRLRDSRGSLLLIDHFDHDNRSQHMFICQPVTKRYREIVWSTVSARYLRWYNYNAAFLLDGGEEDGITMSSFRALFLFFHGDRIHAGVFTSRDSCWQETSIESEGMGMIGLAMGSMYWYTGGRKVVTLDIGHRTAIKFSSFELPDIEDWDSHVNKHRLAVTDASDGRVRIVVGVSGGDDMKVFARQPGGGREWVLVKRIPLFTAIRNLPWREPWYFNQLPLSNHRTGAVLIVTTRLSLSSSSSSRRTTPLMFRLDIETMEVERLPDPNMGVAYPCELPWPPIFRACTDERDRAT